MSDPNIWSTIGNDISSTIDSFSLQNLSPSDIFSMSGGMPETFGGIPILGSRIPSLAKIPIPGSSQLNKLLAPINAAKFGVNGSYEAVHYANDLNDHHPKFKFLFKVQFKGFPGGHDYYYYIHRCDKPKIKFNHTDVNYYNFRTRVLTSVIYEPLQISFLDEVGDSIFKFFNEYLRSVSGTGQGNYGIDKGWAIGSGSASSSLPYQNGYSMMKGQQIIIEQVFIIPGKGGGPRSNRFTFINPRIETFEYDELSHEESSSGSMANMTFSYDAINLETVSDSTLYSWGTTDLFKGGGTSGESNAGHLDGNPMFSDTPPNIKGSPSGIYDALRKGSDLLNNIPSAIGGITKSLLSGILFNAPSSSEDILSAKIQKTLAGQINNSNQNFAGEPGQR